MITDQILKGHELFATMTVDEIHELSKFTSEKEFKAGETIFEYMQVCAHFYMLNEGVVYLQLPAQPSEFSFAISKIAKGELFGLSPLLNATRYTATAKCYEATKVLSIEAKPFRELLQSNCPVGLTIINQVASIYYARYLNILKKLQDIVSQVSMVR
ncbi:MAG: cyclic nucleotide-binding domain-containing protein [Candidatus Hatepunaea meridiana]|nr:cyclic nucleotide-binding domain-containing protein [Candidatus Hatepunaea meridiana]